MHKTNIYIYIYIARSILHPAVTSPRVAGVFRLLSETICRFSADVTKRKVFHANHFVFASACTRAFKKIVGIVCKPSPACNIFRSLDLGVVCCGSALLGICSYTSAFCLVAWLPVCFLFPTGLFWRLPACLPVFAVSSVPAGTLLGMEPRILEEPPIPE